MSARNLILCRNRKIRKKKEKIKTQPNQNILKLKEKTRRYKAVDTDTLHADIHRYNLCIFGISNSIGVYNCQLQLQGNLRPSYLKSILKCAFGAQFACKFNSGCRCCRFIQFYSVFFCGWPVFLVFVYAINLP